MNRRTFLPSFTGGISGSFLLGAIGGTAGTAGAAVGINASRPWSKTSYSQQGEDLIVESICDVLGIQDPSYLDIGAADPTQTNNTYLFYRKGCQGVLIEPNPALCRRRKAKRPGDKVINVGIGFSDQEAADYYMIDGREYLNTFSKGQVEIYRTKAEGMHYVENVIKLPLVNINTIIKKNFPRPPSFLSIDTEGLDLDILKSLDFNRFRPSILCVETLVFGTMRMETEILDLMRSKDYTIRGGTFVNTIFVDKRLLI